MGFLKTIGIIILVYYLLKVLAKWFAPKILSYAAKKTEQHFKQQFGGHTMENQRQEPKPDKKTFNKKSNPSKKVGEYIDFEEIE